MSRETGPGWILSIIPHTAFLVKCFSFPDSSNNNLRPNNNHKSLWISGTQIMDQNICRKSVFIKVTNNVQSQRHDFQIHVMPATSTSMTTENNHCKCRCFCFELLSQNESNLLPYSYLVTQLVIPTTALVTDDDLVVCLRLGLLADDTQQVRLWQCQLSEIFKCGPTLCVISKLDQALFSDQVHLQQNTNRMHTESSHV